jgi:hypothetical protein
MNFEELKTKQREYESLYRQAGEVSRTVKEELKGYASIVFDESFDDLRWDLKEADENGLVLDSRIHNNDALDKLIVEKIGRSELHYGVCFETIYGSVGIDGENIYDVRLHMPWSKVPEHIQKFNIRDFEYQLKKQLLDVEKSLDSRRRWVCEYENMVREINGLLSSLRCH